MTYSLNSNCKDCEKCVERCPVGAIIIHRDNNSTSGSIDSGLCINCGYCGKLCDKGAVIDEKGKKVSPLPEEEWPLPKVDYDKCNGCMICLEICPEYVLALSKPRFDGDLQGVALLLDEEKCMGCGLCAEKCPVDAIEMVKRNAPSKNT